MIYIQPPDVKTRQEILQINLKRIPHEDDVSAADLAVKTSGYSGAEIAALCREGLPAPHFVYVSLECLFPASPSIP